MQPVFFRELEKYGILEIQQSFQNEVDSQEIRELVNNLVERNILEKESEYVKFTYVGFIEFKGYILFIMPKFVSEEEYSNYYPILVRLFKEYSERELLEEEEIDTLGELVDSGNFNIFKIIYFLLEDFWENGLYSNEKIDIELNGEGEISWPDTFEKSKAHIYNQNIVYFDLYTKKFANDNQNYIRKVHMCVLNDCISKLKKFGIFDVLNFPDINFDIEIDQLGDIDYILHRLEIEKSTQYIDRRLFLLDTLYNYLSKQSDILSDNSINLYGTKKFEIVWEKTCGYVFRNDYEKLKYLIPRPIWKDYNTFKETRKETLIPDILKLLEEKKLFFIFDAKYYLTSFNKSGQLINNTPGIGDISKQYLYEMIFKKYFYNKGYKIYNVFLFPSTSKDEVFGHASFELFDNLGPIFLIRLNALQIFKKYIDRNQKDNFYFEEISKKINPYKENK